jgi:hypothetical protein
MHNFELNSNSNLNIINSYYQLKKKEYCTRKKIQFYVLKALPIKIQAFSSNLFPLKFNSINFLCRHKSPIPRPYES